MGTLIDQLSNYMGAESHGILEGEDVDQLKGEIGDFDTSMKGGISQPVHYPLAVSYQGPWKGKMDGMAKHAQSTVRALASSGLPLMIAGLSRNDSMSEELDAGGAAIQHLESVTSTDVVLRILHMVWNTVPYLKGMVFSRDAIHGGREMQKTVASRTIVYTSWERSLVAPEYVEILNDCAEVWVPCLTNQEVFLAAGVERVRVVPYTYDPVEHRTAYPFGSEQVPTGRRFYTIGKWEPRKRQHELLGAFLLAFKPGDRCSLFIKTSWYGSGWVVYPTPENSRKHWMADPEVLANGWTEEHFDRLIRIISDKIPEGDIKALHAKNNIYVSAAAGEAWDIPAFEAKLAGNRLVFVGYGGPEMYADADDVPVEYVMEPVHPDYHWEQKAEWARVTAKNLAVALRQAKPPTVRRMPTSYYERFSHVMVGQELRKVVEGILSPEESVQLQAAGGWGT